jgi:hypothetical protein
MSHGYLVPCDCGHALTVKPSEAGGEVRCPHCRSQHLAPPLSELRRLPIIAEVVQEGTAFQFTFQTLFGIVVFFAMLLSCASGFGFPPTLAVVLVSAAWGLSVAWLGRPFVYASVIAVVMTTFAGITMTTLHRFRDEARRNTSMDNLRQLGGAYKTASDYRTHGSVSFAAEPKQPSAQEPGS